eukprot:TRINITY_DN20121_c0_g1_i3.p1 TRINITY_DN20121_c0_g1~~TRINITY_DN20121_c0_g1_i3.p1  ORF type:complete len:352 (+),score=84.72 TRINITY_DN20121_c0_g1_i3:191-1246(+)
MPKFVDFDFEDEQAFRNSFSETDIPDPSGDPPSTSDSKKLPSKKSKFADSDEWRRSEQAADVEQALAEFEKEMQLTGAARPGLWRNVRKQVSFAKKAQTKSQLRSAEKAAELACQRMAKEQAAAEKAQQEILEAAASVERERAQQVAEEAATRAAAAEEEAERLQKEQEALELFQQRQTPGSSEALHSIEEKLRRLKANCHATNFFAIAELDTFLGRCRMQMVNAIQGLARIDGTDLSATVLWVGLAVQPEGHEHDAFLTQVHTCCNDLLDVPIMHALPDSHGVHLKQKSVAELRRSSAGAEDVTPVTFGESIPHLLVDFLFGRDVHAQSWLETIQPVSYTHLTLPTKRIV